MAILVCQCGKRLNAPGAVPGRQGKCPACGARLSVPASLEDVPHDAEPTPPVRTQRGDDDEPAGGYGLTPPANPARAGAYVQPRGKTRKRSREGTTAIDRLESGGILRRPKRPETGVRGSFRYPLWDLGGVSFLIFVPPVLWFASLMSVGLIPGYVIDQGEVTQMGALTMIAPMTCLLALTLGFAALFLGDVIVTSARGEVHHPRLPAWKPSQAVLALGRWLWAFGCGLALSVPLILLRGVPGRQSTLGAWLVTALFAALGIAYGQMALVGVLLFEDLRAVNPLTVIGALLRAGLGSIPVCLLTGLSALFICAAIPVLFRLPTLWGVLGLWVFWVVVLYLGMTVARALGLFYLRNAAKVGWFPERPRWGA